ncbi:hypothetical protein H0H87_002418 [Tephrocybe sp. NHM501043]|nr:hypothetical protein H0H87_002418 [Tephrocybe sp. NHM501043]
MSESDAPTLQGFAAALVGLLRIRSLSRAVVRLLAVISTPVTSSLLPLDQPPAFALVCLSDAILRENMSSHNHSQMASTLPPPAAEA